MLRLLWYVCRIMRMIEVRRMLTLTFWVYFDIRPRDTDGERLFGSSNTLQ